MGGGGLTSGMPDLAAIAASIGNLMTAISAQGGILSVLAAICGAGLILQALMRWRSSGSGNTSVTIGQIATPFIIGASLVNFWAITTSATATLQLSGGVLSPTFPASYLQQSWGAIKAIGNGFGYIGIFRGLYLWKAAGEGGGGHGSPFFGGLWHLIGGLLLINL